VGGGKEAGAKSDEKGILERKDPASSSAEGGGGKRLRGGGIFWRSILHKLSKKARLRHVPSTGWQRLRGKKNWEIFLPGDAGWIVKVLSPGRGKRRRYLRGGCSQIQTALHEVQKKKKREEEQGRALWHFHNVP